MARKRTRRTVTSGGRNRPGAQKKSQSRLIGAKKGRVNKPRSHKTRTRFDPSLPSSYARLTSRQLENYDRATAVLSDLRRGVADFRALCRKHGISPRSARTYLGRDLIGTRAKTLRARKSDKRIRNMHFPLPQGDLPVQTRNSRDATTLSNFYHDRDRLLHGKMDAHEFETKWRRVRVAGQELFVDTPGIFEMANAGVLKMENLYASTGGTK